MKRIPWFILFISFFISAAGQRNVDYGIFAGVSSYFGDINPGRLMYSPLPAGGVFCRYNLHPRQAIRGSIIFGSLRANDLDFNNAFQRNRAASFSGQAGEVAVQFEFNFLPYTTQGKLWDFSPYLAAGLGLGILSSSAISFQPVIPFSMGFKINIYKNMGLEAEYGFRKTFYDNFDGLNDLVAPSDFAWLHNNDWYSFAGFALTWKIYDQLAGCPAYNDVNGKKIRLKR
jgi:hypothetical protein